MQRFRLDSSGLWISKPGKSATSTSDDDYLITPNRNLGQPLKTGIITSITNQYNASKGYALYSQAVVAHNLGYTPIALAFGNDSGGVRPTVSVDNTNLILSGQSAGNQTYTVSWFYVIFRTALA